MRRLATILQILALAGCAAAAPVEPPPALSPPAAAPASTPAPAPAAPSFPPASLDRIRYGEPALYLALDDSLGSRERIEAAAAEVRAPTPEERLLAIGRWIDRRFRTDPSRGRVFRDFDRMLDEGTLGGNADRAFVFGTLARASGIPCTWVKTISFSFASLGPRDPGPSAVESLRVFLEVFVGNRWRLLDPALLVLYEEYGPAARSLPGAMLAYDKVGDPADLLLPSRPDPFRAQLRAFLEGLDRAALPVLSPGLDLRLLDRTQGDVFIAGEPPLTDQVHDRVEALGVPRTRAWSFAGEWERFLPKAAGKVLVVLCVGGKVALPREYHESYLPEPLEETRARIAKTPPGVLRRLLADGTRVILVYGKDLDAASRAVKTLTLDEPPAAGGK